MDPPNSSPDAADLNRAPGQKHRASKRKAAKRRNLARIILLALLSTVVIGLSAAAGGWAGYRSGLQTQQAAATQAAALSLEEQFNLAVEDMQNGRYDLARQRFEYILKIYPQYPGVSDRLAESLSILYATATPTETPTATPTITPTPTRDLRPMQELFTQAENLVAALSWDQAIEVLLALRKADPAYQTAKVDGMIYISLRQRGFDKIWKSGDLEGGTYDLAQAERFGPLDAQAASARELARLYLFGSSFWEIYPEKAAYFFGQVAAAAPGLHDASGVTAASRYTRSLVQWADQLMAQGDPCAAFDLYNTAGSGELRDAAYQACYPPTKVPKTTEPPSTTKHPGKTKKPASSITEQPLVRMTQTPAPGEPPQNE